MTTILAAIMLRLSGATVEYRVHRIKPKQANVGEGSFDEKTMRIHTTDGITMMRTQSYFKAKQKFRSLRASDVDWIKIRLVATVKARKGNVEST